MGRSFEYQVMGWVGQRVAELTVGRALARAALATLIAVFGCSSSTTESGAAGANGSEIGGVGGGAIAGSGSAMSGFGGMVGSGGAGRTCSASHDINLVGTAVSGAVTVNGVAITDSDQGVGVLSLKSAAGDEADLVMLPASSYSILVAPGSYDLYYNGWSGSDVPSQTTIKLQSGIIVGASPLSLDIDVPATMVSTTVTVGGAAPGNSYQGVGSLELRKNSGERARLAYLIDGTQSLLVVPGSYDLYYALAPSSSAGLLPANTSAKFRTGLVIGNSPVSLEIDLPFTTVSATVTVGGAALAGVNCVPNLVLKNDSGDTAQLTCSSGSASSGRVIPGTYDLYYSSPEVRSDDIGLGLPRNRSTKLQSGIVVASSAVSLQVDLQVTTVAGKLTVNGATLSGLNGTGILTLGNAAGDQVDLIPRSDGSYSAPVIPGTYDVIYHGTSVAGSLAPQNFGSKIRTGIVVGAAPLNLDIDIPVTTVSGSVTLNGVKVPGPDLPDGEGWVSLLDASGGRVTLSSMHAGSFSQTVIPGYYDVFYAIQGSSGATDIPSNRVAVFKKGIVIGPSDHDLDIDVPAVTVSGVVTVNGRTLSDPSNSGVGLLTLNGLDQDVLSPPAMNAFSLGNNNAHLGFTSSLGTNPDDVARGAYSALVIPGAYELFYMSYPGGAEIPRNFNLDLGCFDAR